MRNHDKKRIECSEKPDKCPSCQATPVARIFYGMPPKPEYAPLLHEEVDKGLIILGGCCRTGDDPEWQCVHCGQKIYNKNKAERMKNIEEWARLGRNDE